MQLRSRVFKWCWLVIIACAVIASALGFRVIDSVDWNDVQHDKQANARSFETKILEATVAQIAAESGGTRTVSSTVSVPAPKEKVRTVETRSVTSTTAPEGFSFVEFNGEMETLAIRRPYQVESRRDDGGFTWINGSNAIDELVKQGTRTERDWTFGWMRLNDHSTVAEQAHSLEALAVEIVGTTGPLIRAKLPIDRANLEAILSLPEVVGIGAQPAETKLRMTALEKSNLMAHKQIPVFVTLMVGDPNGIWKSELEDLGAVVGYYDPMIHVYTVNATIDVLESIALTDFAMAIEPVQIVKPLHDTAVPAMGADSLRFYLGSAGSFQGVGGASVPIGVLDSGLNINHVDISSNRESICGANFVYYEPFIDDDDLWVDAGMHGTHVTGTMVGNGSFDPQFAGMAPLVEHIRFAKVLNHWGFGSNVFILRGMDYLGKATSCSLPNRLANRVKPLIVNMSLSWSTRVWEGRSVAERKLDAIVWDRRQLYVVAQSNEDIHGFSNFASAKNSLAVGAIRDGGEVVGFSSHGPTADGRLAPLVVGTGVDVNSTAGDGRRSGYVSLNGTSMASPAVAGVAALLMDAVPAHREQPALVRARMMASAIKPDVWLNNDERFPLDNTLGPGKLQGQYGLGKVSARTSVLNRNQSDGWVSGSAVSEIAGGEYAYHDIHVPEGTNRLDVVMTWDEPPADTLSSTVLNDLDLWLDHAADCETEPCGEFVSQSRVDNVEWLIVPNPEPGTYRIKISATRVYTDPPRAAIAWTTIRGASTPNLEISLDTEQAEFTDEQSSEGVEVTVTLSANEYIAAGTRLQFECRRLDGSGCPRNTRHIGEWGFRVTTEREDGVVQVVRPYVHDAIEIGELAAGEIWQGQLVLRYRLAGNIGEAFRIYVKASAWNANPASASVLIRQVGTESTFPEVAIPTNDRFGDAIRIVGREGSVEVDLVNAQAEPGEPLFAPFNERPAGSVWYEWTAPMDDMVSFSVTPDPAYGAMDSIRVEAFRGDRLVTLDQIASSEWGVQFFANSRQRYLIRVSDNGATAPLRFNWSTGARPANDDFNAATVIAETTGSIDGTNAGATLEPGEFFGGLASTVWYQWVAPNDGAWEFGSSADALNVLAFRGGELANLRLVSGFASERAVFLARAGEVYQIAIASDGASAAGVSFEMTWRSIERPSGNDYFDEAEEIPADETSTFQVSIDRDATVEPGEPAESGIRTKWWSWNPPSLGHYVWRLEELTGAPESGNKLMVSVFKGTSLTDLEFVASNGESMSVEFTFNVPSRDQYWLSVGIPTQDLWAYTSFFLTEPTATLTWGLTPNNDEFVLAESLVGTSGSISRTNVYASSGIGERSDILGRSTLWWKYEASASGWVRFSVDGEGGPWALTVFSGSVHAAGGLIGLVASDRFQRLENEVLFEVRAGTTYTIAVGLRDSAQGGEFSLNWEEGEDPVWLRNVGGVVDGASDSDGNRVRIRNPGDVVTDDRGAAVYVASDFGMHSFARNEITGQLKHIQLLETEFDLTRAAMIWDPHRGRLLVTTCGRWWSFTRDLDALALVDGGEVAAVDDPRPCSEFREHLMLDADGSNVYRVGRSSIDHFVLESDESLRFVQSNHYGGLLRAALSSVGRHVYAVSSNELGVYTRDLDSGELVKTDFTYPIDAPSSPPVPLAITTDDTYLFVFDNDGERANLFSLENPLAPNLEATYSFYREPFQLNGCRFADARTDIVAVDVLCPGMAFSVRWDADVEELVITDTLIEGEADRFNHLTPRFGAPLYEAPSGFVASPDERHIYLSTPEHGILIFGRGSPLVDSDGPDLVVSSISVENAETEPGSNFDLHASVRNEGDEESDSTTLYVYRSEDASIDNEDTELESISVPAIEGGRVHRFSIQLTTPANAGTYYYGICIASVDGEIDETNNCSTAVSVTVTNVEVTGMPDLVIESVTVDNDSSEIGGSFTFSAMVRNKGDAPSEGTTLRFYRSTNPTIASEDTQIGTDEVASLSVGAVANVSRGLTAPSNVGTFYFGACVDAVSDESNDRNNCSTGVRVEVVDDETGSDSFCRDDDVIEPGNRCDIYGTDHYFEVLSNGCHVFTPFGTGSFCGSNANYRSGSIRLVASRNANDSWTITNVEPEPGDNNGGDSDDHGNTLNTATRVNMPSTTSGELESDGDLDYYRVDLTETTTLAAETQGSTDTYGTLFDSAGDTLEVNDDGGRDTNFKLVRDVDAGTYYVEVKGYSTTTQGRYELVLSEDTSVGADFYGAVSYDFNVSDDCPGLAAGITLNSVTESQASITARAACQVDGGNAGECREGTVTFRGCVAMVYGELPGTSCDVYVYSDDSNTPSLSGVESSALAACRSDGNTLCRIFNNGSGVRISGCNSRAERAKTRVASANLPSKIVSRTKQIQRN